ncbi:hypothetical protein [Marinilabilia salmonicolor]|uniref:hypothetical protein n=1 Tax=Marinilabilia salmonicolor TaxID=989 RepID=UPI001F1DBD0A|nr:hypothetical protein [Marinilabilia salmonicolor]
MSSWKFILLLALFGASFFNWGCSARDKGNFDLVWSDEFDYEAFLMRPNGIMIPLVILMDGEIMNCSIILYGIKKMPG